MGILGTQLLEGTGLPTPLYLPSRVRREQVRKKLDTNSTQVRAKKFSPVTLPTVTGLPVVPASLFFVPSNVGRYGMIPGDDAANGVMAVFFDLIKNERHQLRANVSSHPVENGSPLSDHIQNDPRAGSFTAIVSNFSLTRSRSDAFTNKDRTAPTNAALEAYAMLKQLHEDRKLVELVLVLDTYKDVAITDISAPKAAEDGDSITFEISFVQVAKATLKEISIRATVHPPSMKKKKAKQASVTTKNGNTAGFSVTEDSENEVVAEDV